MYSAQNMNYPCISCFWLYLKMEKSFYELELDKVIENDSLPANKYVQVRLSKDFMQKYYAEKIKLESVAEKAFMSHFHYIRIFQKIYGITPKQYLKDIRIEKAKEKLKSGFSVTEVCSEIGYESLPTFSKYFKLATGYSPKEYQKINNRNLE